MASVNDIISGNLNIRSANINTGLTKIDKLARMQHEDKKFDSRAEIDDIGIGSRLDELHSKLIFLKQYETNAIVAKSTLEEQKNKLEELNTVMVDFMKMNSDVSLEMNDEAKIKFANDNLLKIEKILNSTDDKGNLLFGGKNNKPLLFSLTTKSNIVNGEVDTNYTDVSRNEIKLSVNEQNTVDTGLLSVNDKGIAKLIAAINLYKESKGQSREEITLLLREGNKEFSILKTNVLKGLETTKNAVAENAAVKASSKVEIGMLTKANAIEITEQIASNMQAIMMSFQIEASLNKLFSEMEM